MANYILLILLNDQLFLETSIATEIFGGQVSRLSNFVTYCHVLFNRCVLFFLSIHLFLLNISVRCHLCHSNVRELKTSRGHPKDTTYMLCVGSLLDGTDFQQNKLSSTCHNRRAKYFTSIQVKECKNIVRLIIKI